MARVYVATEEEMMALIEKLELVKLRSEASYAPSSAIHKDDIDHLHRVFHRHVVSWAQAIGFDGYRKYG